MNSSFCHQYNSTFCHRVCTLEGLPEMSTKQFLLSVLSYIVCVRRNSSFCQLSYIVCVRLRAPASEVCRSRDFIIIVPSVTVCERTVRKASEKTGTGLYMVPVQGGAGTGCGFNNG